MNVKIFFHSLLISFSAFATPNFIPQKPLPSPNYQINGMALCATAKETLAYLNKGVIYDSRAIHEDKALKIPLSRIKATLVFICQHQNELNNPAFIKKHFDLIRWYPDMEQTKSLRNSKSLIARLPQDKVLMTKYYVHRAKAAEKATTAYPFALYGLPNDEQLLTLEEADTRPNLIRHHYGKQAILKGALNNKNVPVLAYLSRDDLEAALMQGTFVADFPSHRTIFNVHRSNNIPYNKAQNPYQQERFWYFKPVEGIKGYGKDAEYKINVNTEVTFAADLEYFGLGKLLMIQYKNPKGTLVTRAGIFADTGGAFEKNQYQIDFLSGIYSSREAFAQANRHLPDYVTAYFMVLKK